MTLMAEIDEKQDKPKNSSKKKLLIAIISIVIVSIIILVIVLLKRSSNTSHSVSPNLTVQYKFVAGVAANLLSLDVYLSSKNLTGGNQWFMFMEEDGE
jgi:flagellar basal body-associated protein FliL